jgi:large subunit ribosomal protein L25
MQRMDLQVTPRSEMGKGPNRQLRAAGRIPAVIYGLGDPEKVALDYRAFERSVSGAAAENVILTLNFDQGTSVAEINTAIIREVQRDPVTRRILHVDLYRLRMDVENDFEVPVHGQGAAMGVREGGILETIRRTVDIRCLPTDLPTSIEVDISGLRVNHSLHVSDLQVPEGVTLLTDPEEVLFTVLPPKAEVVPVAAEAEAEEEPTQPEVIGKKKEEEGEAEG